MTLSQILWIYCDDDKSAPVSLLYNRILSLCWTFCTITKRKSSVWFPCQKVLFAPRKTFFVIFHFFSLQQKVYNLPTTYLLDRYYQIATAKSFSKKGGELFCKLNFSCKPCHFSSLICFWDDIGWIGLFKELHLQVQLIITWNRGG